VVEAHLKNMSQNGNLPQGVEKKYLKPPPSFLFQLNQLVFILFVVSSMLHPTSAIGEFNTLD